MSGHLGHHRGQINSAGNRGLDSVQPKQRPTDQIAVSQDSLNYSIASGTEHCLGLHVELTS